MSNKNPSYKYSALAGTLVFHALLFLIFFLIVFKTPIPPFPESGAPGIEVNFGTSDEGMGEIQPEETAGSNSSTTEPEASKSEPVESQTKSQSTKVLTQQSEEAPSLTSSEATNKNEKPAEKKEPEPRKPNKAAMYPGSSKNNSKSSGSEGETNKTGDQGDENGSRNSKYHGPGGGSGDTPNEKGNGGKGNGPSYSLAGRKPKSLPVPKSSFQEEGKVVVEITVDRSGNVIAAKPGIKGSTTSNAGLLDIAKKAAMSAKFNIADDAPEVQKGTITYNFTFVDHNN